MLTVQPRTTIYRRLGLALVTLPEPDLDDHDVGVEVTINGIALPEVIRSVKGLQYDGYVPASLECMGLVEERCDDRLRLARPSPFAGKRIRLLVCSCGDVGCGSFDVTVRDDGETVRWSWLIRSWTDAGRRFGDIASLRFQRRAYLKAVARLEPAIGSLLRRRNAAWASAKEAARRARGRA